MGSHYIIILEEGIFLYHNHLVNTLNNTCTCKSFKYGNYKKKHSCKHLEVCKSIDLTDSTIKGVNNYNDGLPKNINQKVWKKMEEEIEKGEPLMPTSRNGAVRRW